MNGKSPWKCVGGTTALIAMVALWITGGNPFSKSGNEVPVVISVRPDSRDGMGQVRLSIRNVGGQPLSEVQICGYDANGGVHVQRKGTWSPDEEVILGSHPSWIAAGGTEIEISALGYSPKKHSL